MRRLVFLLWIFAIFFVSRPAFAAEEFLSGVKRILILGDSITYAGQYVADFELFLLARYPERKFEVIDLGLPSETVSGLSEEGHADGKFPRPDLHERLDRALPKIKPDLVLACYGMNDGIYLPLDEGRFAKFREGMQWLHEKVQASGAKIIHLTPPAYHALADRPKPGPDGNPPASWLGGYNLVLDRYSEWLLGQRAQGWQVIDLHGPMNAFLEAKRKAQPDFVFAKDGVHPNDEGHALLADQLIAGLAPADFPAWQKFRAELATNPQGPAVIKLVRQRSRVLCDAWLNDVGHQRPGMAKGLPVAEAETRAAALEKELVAILPAWPKP